jgi:hypothetical protein
MSFHPLWFNQFKIPLIPLTVFTGASLTLMLSSYFGRSVFYGESSDIMLLDTNNEDEEKEMKKWSSTRLLPSENKYGDDIDYERKDYFVIHNST